VIVDSPRPVLRASSATRGLLHVDLDLPPKKHPGQRASCRRFRPGDVDKDAGDAVFAGKEVVEPVPV